MSFLTLFKLNMKSGDKKISRERRYGVEGELLAYFYWQQ